MDKESLNPDFIAQIGHLKRKISKFLRPKRLLNKTLDGISFLLVVEEYLNIFNKGETLTISGIVQRTEQEERKFLMNHIQDWIDYFFETNFLDSEMVQKAVIKLLEMAGEDNIDFRFEVFQKAFQYFQEELVQKKESEKAIRLKFLIKSLENVNSAWPELEGIDVLHKILEDESLKQKLFSIEEIYEGFIENLFLKEKATFRNQLDIFREKLNNRDSNCIFLQDQLELLQKENIQWKTELSKLEQEYQNLRIKMNSQKEELIHLRKISSGESSLTIQLEVLIKKNAELNQENLQIKQTFSDLNTLRLNENLVNLLEELKISEEDHKFDMIAHHMQEVLVNDNNLLRKRIIELEQNQKNLEENIKKLSISNQNIQKY